MTKGFIFEVSSQSHWSMSYVSVLKPEAKHSSNQSKLTGSLENARKITKNLYSRKLRFISIDPFARLWECSQSGVQNKWNFRFCKKILLFCTPDWLHSHRRARVLLTPQHVHKDQQWIKKVFLYYIRHFTSYYSSEMNKYLFFLFFFILKVCT